MMDEEEEFYAFQTQEEEEFDEPNADDLEMEAAMYDEVDGAAAPLLGAEESEVGMQLDHQDDDESPQPEASWAPSADPAEWDSAPDALPAFATFDVPGGARPLRLLQRPAPLPLLVTRRRPRRPSP